MPLTTPLPAEFARLIQQLLPEEAEALLGALEGEASVSVRRNAAKCSALPSELPLAEPVAWSQGLGYYLSRRPSFTADPLWHAGQYYVQEASSMTLAAISPYLGEEPLAALDLCAAPGGKSTLLLDLLPAGSTLVSNEYVRSRAHILTENLQKWGSPYSIVTSTDAASLGRMRSSYDLILVDAPCSGEGMMRKDEEARRQWSPQLVSQCAALQRSILEDIWPALAPGGLLVYSTCTLNGQEDEAQVAYLVEELGAEPLGLQVLEPFVAPSALSPYPCYRMMSHRTRGEGLFLALLRKPITEGTSKSSTARKSKAAKAGRSASVKPPKELLPWLEPSPALQWRTLEETRLLALPDPTARLLEELEALRIPVLSAGLQVAELKGRDWLPQPALALSQLLAQEAFPRVELTHEESLRYLAGEALTLPPETPRGFVLIAYQGASLGFAKHLGNRTNNLYPQPWRIRQLDAVLRRLEESQPEEDVQ